MTSLGSAQEFPGISNLGVFENGQWMILGAESFWCVLISISFSPASLLLLPFPLTEKSYRDGRGGGKKIGIWAGRRNRDREKCMTSGDATRQLQSWPWDSKFLKFENLNSFCSHRFLIVQNFPTLKGPVWFWFRARTVPGLRRLSLGWHSQGQPDPHFQKWFERGESC